MYLLLMTLVKACKVTVSHLATSVDGILLEGYSSIFSGTCQAQASIVVTGKEKLGTGKTEACSNRLTNMSLSLRKTGQKQNLLTKVQCTTHTLAFSSNVTCTSLFTAASEAQTTGLRRALVSFITQHQIISFYFSHLSKNAMTPRGRLGQTLQLRKVYNQKPSTKWFKD